MKYNKSKLFASLLAGTAMLSASLATQASEVVHSGINCEAANLAQANLMSWNKDGITNNSVLDLFVICPVDIDQNDWDGTPSLQIGVSIFMPPNYDVNNGGDGTGPFCSGRSGIPNNVAPTDDKSFVSESFNVGSFSGSGVNGDVDSATVTLNLLSNSTSRSAHLLCLLPKLGGTLLNYRGSQL